VRQLSDRPHTLSASANASRLFMMLRQYLIGGDYNECLRGRQTYRSYYQSIEISKMGKIGTP
jgi:hypothetical protein